jgi:hypothetical protein
LRLLMISISTSGHIQEQFLQWGHDCLFFHITFKPSCILITSSSSH